MNEGWFSKPVPVAEGIAGDIRYVSSARQAMNMLNGSWREQGTAQHREAMRACQRAINGEASSEIAMTTFADAAKEARVLAE